MLGSPSNFCWNGCCTCGFLKRIASMTALATAFSNLRGVCTGWGVVYQVSGPCIDAKQWEINFQHQKKSLASKLRKVVRLYDHSNTLSEMNLLNYMLKSQSHTGCPGTAPP